MFNVYEWNKSRLLPWNRHERACIIKELPRREGLVLLVPWERGHVCWSTLVLVWVFLLTRVWRAMLEVAVKKSAMKYHIRGTLGKTKLTYPTCFGGLKRSLTKVQKTTTAISKANVASTYRSVICTTVQLLQTLLFEFSCVKIWLQLRYLKNWAFLTS